MRRNKIIGITGGIGSGKSLVLSYIESHYDVTVIRADDVGHELMAPGRSVYEALVSYYGERILRENRTIDTGHLAAIGLRDQASQAILNGIEHPLIREEILRLAAASEKPVVFIEAALLSEGGLVGDCDEVWVVFADRDVRIRRLKKDRGYTDERCEAFIGRQLSDDAFKALADRLIVNNGDFSETETQIRQSMTEVMTSLCE